MVIDINYYLHSQPMKIAYKYFFITTYKCEKDVALLISFSNFNLS